ncbi:glycoside hydrolase family 2 protein [Fulvivirga sediminis]|uniref:Beta-glucuronidase n=1 Tax=Fulvivirga sediminis TaxID=2803949 RepID=A0A937JXX5_9BACT|nr:glycoside hydrolase family 2 TIM barrel-domain containing protein [Fulvivirga sediminis]MBL3655089.1 beta-glucuronidase [Fulvivirga sediminis]
MKYLNILLLLFVVSTAVRAQSSLLQNPYSRDHISLNGPWHYIADPYENGYYNYRRKAFDEIGNKKGGYYDNLKQNNPMSLIEYDFDHAPTLDVPGDWNSQVEKLELYEGTVWYQRAFVVSPEKGKKYWLYFGAVNYEAHVYLNGKKLGTHKGGFTPFQFEVTDLLHEGDNFIVLKVDNARHQDEVPTVNTDWWNYGGVTRDVLLINTPDSYIQDYQLKLNPANNKEIRGFVKVEGEESEVKVAIPELKVDKAIAVDRNGYASFAIPVKKVVYWSPENPKLYEVQISSSNDMVLDKIGFRTITTEGTDILLNGKSVFLRGISMHEENPFLPGRLRGEGDIKMLFQWAKELNCNFIRLAHYPHDEKALKLADEMGLMVWAEIPVYWTISWENEATYKNAEAQLTDMIVRDKNRASIMIWSVGNETPVSEPRMKFMGGLADKVRSLDDSRLVAAALEVSQKEGEMVWTCDDPLVDKIDLVSFNEYAGWYWLTPSELSKIKFEFDIDKPVFISEFGAGALGGFHSEDRVRWSEEYQEDLYIKQIKLLTEIKQLRGVTPWILVDFRSPRRPHSVYQNFWNRKGLISNTGDKKKAFFILKDYYQKQEEAYKK